MWAMALNKLDTMRFFGADMNAQKIEMLKNIPIFHDLTRKEILEVDELLHERIPEGRSPATRLNQFMDGGLKLDVGFIDNFDHSWRFFPFDL